MKYEDRLQMMVQAIIVGFGTNNPMYTPQTTVDKAVEYLSLIDSRARLELDDDHHDTLERYESRRLRESTPVIQPVIAKVV